MNDAKPNLVPRGIRNNNPGNIRRGIKWQGLTDVQSDHAFCEFATPEWGIRAIVKILRTYYLKHKVRTVAEIIARWAPPSENNTAAYAAAVAKAVGRGTHEPYRFIERPELERLVRAIIRHENGVQPYSDLVINAGLDLALGKPEGG